MRDEGVALIHCQNTLPLSCNSWPLIIQIVPSSSDDCGPDHVTLHVNNVIHGNKVEDSARYRPRRMTISSIKIICPCVVAW